MQNNVALPEQTSQAGALLGCAALTQPIASWLVLYLQETQATSPSSPPRGCQGENGRAFRSCLGDHVSRLPPQSTPGLLLGLHRALGGRCSLDLSRSGSRSRLRAEQAPPPPASWEATRDQLPKQLRVLITGNGTISGFTFQPINAQSVQVNTRLSGAQEASRKAQLGGTGRGWGSARSQSHGACTSALSGAARPTGSQPYPTPVGPKTRWVTGLR